MSQLDLHIHSIYSKDSILELKEIIEVAKKKGLNGIAITDHDTIKGSLEALKLNKEINKDKNFIIIPGEELRTEIGDILVLFIKEEIKSRKLEEIYKEAKGQGGIVILAHPFRKSIVSSKNIDINPDYVKKYVDAIEVFNSHSTRKQNKAARELANKLNKPIICGSDAHLAWEIGKSVNIFQTTNIKQEILDNKTQISTSYSPYLKSRVLTALSTILRLFSKT